MSVHYIHVPSRDAGMVAPACGAHPRKRGSATVTHDKALATCAKCCAWLKRQVGK